MADGGVDGQDESVGHQFQGISFCRTHNCHSAVDFSTSYRCAPTAAQQTKSAEGDRRGDDRREATTGMDVDIVASTQEPQASITSRVIGHRRGNDTLQSRYL